MKHPSFFLLFCMAVCLTACSDDKTSHSGLRELIISDMTFNCDQGSKTLVFRNEDLSTIECKTGTSWCTASIDAINSHLTVSVQANDTYDARTDTVTLADRTDGAMRTFIVTQARNTGLFIGETSFEASMYGDTITVDLESNVSYKVLIPDSCSWITMGEDATTRGLEKSSFNLYVAENKTYHERRAYITVVNRDENLSGTVTVIQPFNTVFEADSTSFSRDMDGGIVTINMKSNIPYEVQIPDSCSWVHLQKAATSRAVSSSSITLKVDENRTYHDRDALLSIYNREADTEIPVSIHQSFVTVFNVDSTKFDIDMEGGTFTVNIEANIPYDVTIPSGCDWVKTKDSSAARTNHKAQSSKLKAQSSKSAVVFRVKENTGYSQRDAVVTIGNKDAGASVKIYISQKAFEASLSVEKTEYEVPMKGGDVTVSVESNVDFDVIIPSNCNWINNVSPSRSKTARTSIVTLRVSENKSGQDRNANVTISNADAGVSANISITQKFDEVFSIDTTTLETDELADTLGVTVAANVDVTVQSQAAWLKVGAKTDKSAGHWTQQIFVSPLTTKVAKRTGKVKFLNTATNKAEYVEVVQHRLLYISESEVSLSEKGQTVTPTLNNSEGMPVKWTSSNTDVATVSSAGKVTALANGSTVITVKSTDGKYSDKVNVTVEIVEDEEKEGDNPESRKRRLMKKRR